MPDELRRCWLLGCCHFVNNQPVTPEEYEEAVKRNQPGFGLPGPTESLISCRKTGGQDAAEISTGFYLGTRVKRAFGTVIPDGKMPYIYDRATGNLLREATEADIRKWNEAHRKAVEDAQKSK